MDRMVSPDPRWNLYFMQTDHWYLQRRIYLVVGFNLSLASILTLANTFGGLRLLCLSAAQ